MADKSWDDQYISKTDAIKLAIISIVPFANADNINGIQNSFEKTIGDFPSADVAEVRHGKWINKTMSVPSSHGQTYGRYGCSVCKNKVRYKSNFCPNCGSDMRKDGE